MGFFISLKTEWKPLLIGVAIMGVFFFGYHYKSLGDAKQEVSRLQAQISATNIKLADNNKIDIALNKEIINYTATGNAAIKELGIYHAPDNYHCLIPAEWVRALAANN